MTKARIVSARPLIFDVLSVDTGSKSERRGLCGPHVYPLADERLKRLLSRLRFNQVFQATVGPLDEGKPGLPDKLVLMSIAPDDGVSTKDEPCTNSSGVAFAYHDAIEYVVVSNDGTIDFQDSAFNRFTTQKLSRDQLASCLKAFADVSFDRIPSTPPPAGKPDQSSITLIAARYQRVPLQGREDQLAPLLRRLETLKDRARSQGAYLLLTGGRDKLTILEWPFRQIRLNQYGDRQFNEPEPAAMRDLVPEPFFSSLGSLFNPAQNLYFTDQDHMYRVTVRSACGPTHPRCSEFRYLRVYPVVEFQDSLPPDNVIPPNGGIFWPASAGVVDLEQVGPEGFRIPNEDFEKYRSVYGKLYDVVAPLGRRFILDGYLYKDVRICRANLLVQPVRCVSLGEVDNVR